PDRPHRRTPARRKGRGTRYRLRAGQGVVEEVRLDLGVEQAQFRLAQLLGAGGIAYHGLFAAPVFGDAAGDGAGDRLGRLQVAAVVDAQPVGPGRALRLAGQADAGRVAARRHGSADHVGAATELAVDPVHRIEAVVRAVRVGTLDAGAHAQAAGGRFDVDRARQFAQRGVEQAEG